MKKILIITCYIFITLLSNPILAQPEDPGADPAAPIGDHIWVLVIVGLVYVFYKVRLFTLQGK